jgi:dihydrolipoamide dehydrogenase
MASGMARILDQREGFLKIISAVPGGQIIGASIIGPYATELIASLTIMVRNRLTLKNLQETILAHPSISEALGDAVARVES